MQGQTDAAGARLLPITSFQRMMLAAAVHPDTKPGFFEHKTIRWAFRITPSLPDRRVRRAFDTVVARHESLRLRFVNAGRDWQVMILPRHPTGLVVEDLSHLAADEQDAVIRARALTPMSALSDPLFEMVLFHCGSQGDVVLTRADHTIMDGYSVVIVIEEMLKSVLNLPLAGKPPGHGDFIGLTLRRLRERAAEKEAFWQARLLPLPPDPMIGRRAKGLPPISPQEVGPTVKSEPVLTDDEARALEKTAKVSGASAFSLLHAAFSEALCAMSGQDEVIVVSVLGRKDAALSGFVGSDVQGLFVKYQTDPGDLTGRAQWLARALAEGADQVPTTAFLPGGAIQNAFDAQGSTRMRFLVHIGHPSGRIANSPLRKLFGEALQGKLSLGPFSLERIDLSGATQTDFEIEFLIGPTNGYANGVVIADGAALTPSELAALVGGLRTRLGLEDRKHGCAPR